MDIYLTNLETRDRLRFPMLPQQITVKAENRFASYSILSAGDIRIPSGTSPDSFTWEGVLPGEKRKSAPYIREWKDPKAVCKWLENLKGEPIKARLLITETSINCDVYLNTFQSNPTGRYGGDVDYTLTLIQAKEIRVSKCGGSDEVSSAPERTAPPLGNTYTVVKGDCLWKIAQQFYGRGALYTKIYEANKKVIGKNPNRIYAGQVLTIPNG